MNPLVIGCGEADRGDDAAGLLVARQLRTMGLEVLENDGEAALLMDSWNNLPEGQEVILIDAVVTGAPAGTITVWDASIAPARGDFFRCSTHAFGVAEAVNLARVLDLLPANLRIFGIEGARFDAGSEPSPAVVEAVEQVAERIAREVTAVTSLR